MRVNLGKLAHVAAAGAMVLAIGAFDGYRLGPQGAAAREAAAIPGTFASAIIVANPNASTANVTMSFVTDSGGGALPAPLSFTVAPGGSSLQYVPNVPGLADGRYSVVIDSDVSVVATANLASSSPATATSYVGIPSAETSTTFYIPDIERNYVGIFSTSLVIQNAGSAAANVTITYKDRNGVDVTTETKTIPVSASVTVDQTSTPGLPENFLGSGIIQSDQPIAALLLSSKAQSGSYALSAARGASTGAAEVYLPGIWNRYANHNTAVLVQNVDSTSATVTIKYYDTYSGALVGQEVASVAPGATKLFLQFDAGKGLPAGSGLTTPFNGSAVVSSDKNVVAIGKVDVPETSWAEGYNAATTNAATSSVLCSTILMNYAAERFNTAVGVQNVGTSPTDITISYKDAGGNTVKSVTRQGVAPGASFFRYNPSDLSDQGSSFKGSLTATASGGGKIAAIVNQTNNGAGDQLNTYNCANIAS